MGWAVPSNVPRCARRECLLSDRTPEVPARRRGGFPASNSFALLVTHAHTQVVMMRLCAVEIWFPWPDCY